MAPTPIVKTAHEDEHRPAPIVAKYEALVVGEVVWSDLALLPGLPEVVASLREAPGYAVAWPPRPRHVAEASADGAEVVVLRRLKALFDFGARLREAEVGDIIKQVRERWPAGVAPASTDGDRERITVRAFVRADGEAEWEYERAPHDAGTKRADDDAVVDGRTELDLFVQNLVRADLETRLLKA